LLAAADRVTPRFAAEQPSCRQLAGRDLVPVNRDGVFIKLTERLALGELESLARALLAVLLALLHAGVAEQKTLGAKRRPQFGIELRNGARQTHTDGTSLSAHAATMRGDNYVHLLGHVGEFERLGSVVLPCKIREVVVDRAFVYSEFARAGAQKYARDRFLAAAGTQKPICARDGRARRTQRSS